MLKANCTYTQVFTIHINMMDRWVFITNESKPIPHDKNKIMKDEKYHKMYPPDRVTQLETISCV